MNGESSTDPAGTGDEVEFDVDLDTPNEAEVREAIAAGLKTTDVAVIADAAGDFCGVHGSVMEYVRTRVTEFLPPVARWVLDCCENDRLLHAYEAGKFVVWTLPHPGNPRRVLVFESPRANRRNPPELKPPQFWPL